MANATRPTDLELHAFLLRRLERFTRLAGTANGMRPSFLKGLACHATFSALRDCQAIGLGDEARAVIARSIEIAGSRVRREAHSALPDGVGEN